MHCLGADPKYLIGKFPHSKYPPKLMERVDVSASPICGEKYLCHIAKVIIITIIILLYL